MTTNFTISPWKKQKKIKEQDINIDAVILAGGKNRRFKGKQKSLARIEGKTILRRQLEVLKPIFPEIILVTNHFEEFSEYNELKLSEDIVPDKGPLSGIHAGMVNSTSSNIFVFAGDMPFLNADLIKKQIQISCSKQYEAIIPKTIKGIEPLHGIYNKKALKTLESLLEQENVLPVKSLLNKVNTFYWLISDQKAFVNINTIDDLKNLWF